MITTMSLVGFPERKMSVKLLISFLCSLRHLESLALAFHEAADIEDIDPALELSSHLATISINVPWSTKLLRWLTKQSSFELSSIRISSGANVAEAQQIKLQIEAIETLLNAHARSLQRLRIDCRGHGILNLGTLGSLRRLSMTQNSQLWTPAEVVISTLKSVASSSLTKVALCFAQQAPEELNALAYDEQFIYLQSLHITSTISRSLPQWRIDSIIASLPDWQARGIIDVGGTISVFREGLEI
ncbi:hypothetical protein C8J56DRAFT_955106 [Mycena floridula]|nr:hypothetical protein C8J56DRAFT_955106 [Mycena floridula]